MRTILLVAFWGNCVAIACRLLFLAFESYPRRPEITRPVDVLAVTFLIAWVAWIGLALWGGS